MEEATPPALAELEAGLLRLLGPARPHPAPAEGHLYDVVIVGAGQAGLSTAWALVREGVDNLLVTDRNPEGSEGPWATFARMPTLRTPKGPTGVDLGVPELTISAWYEARFGEQAWRELALIPTRHWMDYLLWLRAVTRLPVANGWRLTQVLPDDEASALRLDYETPAGPVTLRARKLVLATGYEGAGGAKLLPLIDALPREVWAHSSEMIDFGTFVGRVVGVIGAGASAFDNAATAAEAGAEVHQFVRRSELPKVNLVRWMDFTTFARHFCDLPDARRRAYVRHFLGTAMPPPPETLLRVSKLTTHTLHFGAPPLAARVEGGRVVLTTPQGEQALDLLILGTGFRFDLALRPELRAVMAEAALWGDRAPAEAPDALDAQIDRYPYLGPEFQLQPRMPGRAPWLGHIHVMNSCAVASIGPVGSGGINGLKFSTPRLVRGLLRDLAAPIPAALEMAV